MINKLNNDTLYYLLNFLTNYDIMMMLQVSKEINQELIRMEIEDFMNYREHPIVFNQCDNYCALCNQGIIIYNKENKNEDFKFIICNHS